MRPPRRTGSGRRWALLDLGDLPLCGDGPRSTRDGQLNFRRIGSGRHLNNGEAVFQGTTLPGSPHVALHFLRCPQWDIASQPSRATLTGRRVGGVCAHLHVDLEALDTESGMPRASTARVQVWRHQGGLRAAAGEQRERCAIAILPWHRVAELAEFQRHATLGRRGCQAQEWMHRGFLRHLSKPKPRSARSSWRRCPDEPHAPQARRNPPQSRANAARTPLTTRPHRP